ncbi:shikimate kinase [Nioella ostreopsis]|uniref:shikimate kinase n=1 Tax=Nioella ostreopsis TaxID=2448479 RepID=UPI000FD9FD6A|nr:shikimate kinase [Nioella ostreopsis]
MGETTPDIRAHLTRTVVLVGMMGAGKTAIGKALSAQLAVPFEDSDAEIEAASKLTIAEIFDRYGEPFFRDKESQVIARLLDGPPCVLSTGGGAWLSPENRAYMAERAAVVWLKADIDLLWTRVKHKSTRPLLRTANPRATLAQLLEARTPAYEQAEFTVETRADWSIDQTTAAVMDTLTRAGIVETRT